MNKLIAPLSAALLVLALASYAQAMTITANPGSQIGSVPGGDVNFSSLPVPMPGTTFTQDNITFAPTAGGYFGGLVVSGSLVNNWASPANYTGNYMAILGGQSETLTFAHQMDIFGLYWGSLDDYNSIEFLLKGNVVELLSGAQVAGLAIATPPLSTSGSWSSSNANAYITFSNLKFDEVVLSSSDNSFEFTNVAAAAPEPASWAMMILGFIGVGLMSYRRSRRNNTAFGVA